MTDLNFSHGLDVIPEENYLTIEVDEGELDGSQISGTGDSLTEEEVEDFVGDGFIGALVYDYVNGQFEFDETAIKDGGGQEIDASEFAGGLGAAGEIIETDGAALSYVEPDGRYAPASHAPSHKDGGADEIDASELAGGLGVAGEILETDGAALSYVEPDGRYSPAAHAASHKDGGADELDAAELAGALGTAGEVLQSDGAAASWATLVHTDISDFDEGAQDAVGGITDATLAYDDATPSFGIDLANANTWTANQTFDATVDANLFAINGSTVAQSVVASGQVQLSSGTAVVDTALSATDATFHLALGVDDPNADTKISGRLFWDDSAGTYKIEIVETETSVGNPTVNYDVVRVR